jgi:hypothetical protein
VAGAAGAVDAGAGAVDVGAVDVTGADGAATYGL